MGRETTKVVASFITTPAIKTEPYGAGVQESTTSLVGFNDTSKNTTSGPELLPKLSVSELGFDTLRTPVKMNQLFRRENGFVFDDAECSSLTRSRSVPAE